MSRLSEKDRWEIAKLRALGYSQTEIARRLGVAQTTVAYQLRKLRGEAAKGDPEKLLAGLAIAGGAIIGALFLSNYLKGKKQQQEVKDIWQQ